MTPLSVVMIVKNEGRNLPRCLDSLGWADEIVVLDTGSNDGTMDIARSRGCKTAVLEKWEGFGKAKQAAVELATHDWVLSIDADEVVSAELQKELRGLMERDFEGLAWRLRRRSYYLGRPIRYCGWQNDAPLRLFDRRQGGFDSKPVHESVVTDQNKRACQGFLYHYTYPTRQSHFSKMRLYGDLAAKELAGRGKRSSPLEAVIRAKLKFLKMYFLRLGFLDGWTGFQLCLNSAWGVGYKYFKLWRLGR
ncbi:MAG: glycosyltransferase family 2 protein [Candidatus Syntrophosphaera sp.]